MVRVGPAISRAPTRRSHLFLALRRLARQPRTGAGHVLKRAAAARKSGDFAVHVFVGALLHLFVGALRALLDVAQAVADHVHVPVEVASVVPPMLDEDGRARADVELLHALSEIATTANDLKLVARARVPLE